MAQVVKLKRTSVQGRIPTISNLELGELAINTYDGRIFFEKDDGILSIQEILTTNSQNSGSFNLTGVITSTSITASNSLNVIGTSNLGVISGSSLYLSGNSTIQGNLTLGGNITIGDETTDVVSVTAGFSGSLLPDETVVYDLGSPSKKWNNVYASASRADYFIGDGSGLTNITSSLSSLATVTSSFDNESTISVIHSFDSKNIIVSVYGTDYSQIIPQSVTLTDNDTVDIVLSNTGSGHVVVAKGGHIIASSDLDSYRLDVSGASSYAITHSLNEEYPFVQVWNTETKKMEQPLDVETTSSSSLTVSFSSNFAGKIIVKK